MTLPGASVSGHPTSPVVSPAEEGMRNNCEPSVFPLPRVSLKKLEVFIERRDIGHCAPPTSRRQLRRTLQDTNESIMALNWLAGHRTSIAGESPTGRVQALHDSAAERVMGAVLDRGTPDLAPTSREALNGLLRGRGLYTDETSRQASVAPYRPGHVSLPDSVHGAPSVRDLLPADVSSYLSGRGERMLRGDDDRISREYELGPAGCHVDPKFSNARAYGSFVKKLRKAGLVDFSREVHERAGFFSSLRRTGPCA